MGVPDDIELHKPYIDKVLLKCPKCGTGLMKRVTEVIDCWFDSGAMPFAQWHYPFENSNIFNDNFPADFISEALDQTRGWFYTLLAISTLLFDQPSYKNVIVLGLVQDKNGQKMSKHKGNVVDPWTILDKQGADAVRWYFYAASAPWLPSRFYEEAVSEGQRKFMGTLWNTYAFYVLYANIDNFNPSDYSLDYNKLTVMDRWILSRLHSLIELIEKNLDSYRITESARAIQEFTDDLSNWYVRRSRERFWQKDMTQDKINAYMTLHTVLLTITKLIAPFVPFIAEEIYLNLAAGGGTPNPESVHLCDFPAIDRRFIDTELETNMKMVLEQVVLGRACRNSANIKNRQPIGKMYVRANYELPSQFRELVEDELNVKEIIFTDEADKFTDYKFKPQLKTLGPRYGKLVPQISQALSLLDGNETMKTFKEGKKVSINAGGQQIELAEEDVLAEITQKAGFVSETERDTTVVLDTNLTDELIEEGFVREIISKVQTMRKEAGFEVQDHIGLYYRENAKIAVIIENNSNIIAEEVLATNISEGRNGEYVKEWNINGENVKLAVKRL